jgi:benzoylformate decarboxylase
MSLARLATELNRAIEPDTILVEHATTSTPVLMNYLRVPRPENIFGTGGSVQGWGTPASIGIQMGRPDQRVLAIVGDGGFTFTCQALWSAGRYGVPVTILVLNNRGYRSMRSGVLRHAKRAAASGVDFGFDFEVNIGQAARAFGVDATRISDPSHVADAVRGGLRGDRPNVIEVMISPHPFPWI